MAASECLPSRFPLWASRARRLCRQAISALGKQSEWQDCSWEAPIECDFPLLGEVIGFSRTENTLCFHLVFGRERCVARGGCSSCAQPGEGSEGLR
ncbi:hypothetical protein MOSE0_H05072 [Monosporozyma servazzii]